LKSGKLYQLENQLELNPADRPFQIQNLLLFIST
jgi:hypothetical protein